VQALLAIAGEASTQNTINLMAVSLILRILSQPLPLSEPNCKKLPPSNKPTIKSITNNNMANIAI
jgi:hypothetical protein